MICPRCDVEMIVGIAIEPKIVIEEEANYPITLTFVPPPKKRMEFNRLESSIHDNSVAVDEVKIINVLKCPTCGHSDDRK